MCQFLSTFGNYIDIASVQLEIDKVRDFQVYSFSKSSTGGPDIAIQYNQLISIKRQIYGISFDLSVY